VLRDASGQTRLRQIARIGGSAETTLFGQRDFQANQSKINPS